MANKKRGIKINIHIITLDMTPHNNSFILKKKRYRQLEKLGEYI